MTTPVLNRKYGWKAPKHKDPRDWKFKASRKRAATLPTSADLRTTGFLPPVYDQGQLGACGPNAASGALAYDEVAQGQKVAYVPSRLYIYFNTRVLMNTVGQDSGVDNRTMFKALARWGYCNENLMPYSDDATTFLKKPTSAEYGVGWHSRIVNYFSVNQDAVTIKACLAGGSPVVVGFTVYESFESQQVANTGVARLPEPGEQVLGGHDVLCVGYSDADQTWLLRNSWGSSWGQKGYFTFPYPYLLTASLSDDFWNVKTVP